MAQHKNMILASWTELENGEGSMVFQSEDAEISQQGVTESNYHYEQLKTYNASHAAGVDEVGAGLPRLPYSALQI
jgi:hypothetical protein